MDHAIRESSSSAASTRVVDVLVPVALNQTYSYPCPVAWSWNPATSSPCRWDHAKVIAVVWAQNPKPDPRLHNRLKDVGRKTRCAAPEGGTARARRLGCQLHALRARHGAAHGPADGREPWPERMRLGVRLIGQAPRRITPARRRLIEVCPIGLLHGNRRPRGKSGVSAGVIDGLVDEGTLAVEAMPPPPAPHAAGSFLRAAGVFRQQRTAVDAMRALAANGSFHVALLDGVHWLGQDRSVFRGDRGSHPSRENSR